MSETRAKKTQKCIEIKNLIHTFGEIHLNDELEHYCNTLCDTLGRKRKINILRGKSEQWAASIVYVIARLNFLFDQKNEFHITADIICDHFHTKKTTTGNKATLIEQQCNISMGSEEFCSKEISDMFTFYETESGFVIPGFMINNKEVVLVFDEEEETIKEKREREKQTHLKELEEKAKKRKSDKDQMGLFDD